MGARLRVFLSREQERTLLGCVAKSEGDGRVGKLRCYRSASHVYSPCV